jgi:hypothetical protein
MQPYDVRSAESWSAQPGARYAGSPLAARVVPFQTVVERSFMVEAPVNVAWDHLTKLEQWPSWAPHIKRVELTPPGALAEGSRGIFHQRRPMTATFQVKELRYLRNLTLRGRVMGIEIEYDHRLEAVSEHRTQVTFVAGCRGAGAGLTIKLFTMLHGRSLDQAIPLLIAEINGRSGIRHR